MSTTNPGALPQYLLPPRTAPNAELLRRMMAADELAPEDTRLPAMAVRQKAEAAQAEMDRRKAEGLA